MEAYNKFVTPRGVMKYPQNGYVQQACDGHKMMPNRPNHKEPTPNMNGRNCHMDNRENISLYEENAMLRKELDSLVAKCRYFQDLVTQLKEELECEKKSASSFRRKSDMLEKELDTATKTLYTVKQLQESEGRLQCQVEVLLTENKKLKLKESELVTEVRQLKNEKDVMVMDYQRYAKQLHQIFNCKLEKKDKLCQEYESKLKEILGVQASPHVVKDLGETPRLIVPPGARVGPHDIPRLNLSSSSSDLLNLNSGNLEQDFSSGTDSLRKDEDTPDNSPKKPLEAAVCNKSTSADIPETVTSESHMNDDVLVNDIHSFRNVLSNRKLSNLIIDRKTTENNNMPETVLEKAVHSFRNALSNRKLNNGISDRKTAENNNNVPETVLENDVHSFRNALSNRKLNNGISDRKTAENNNFPEPVLENDKDGENLDSVIKEKETVNLSPFVRLKGGSSVRGEGGDNDYPTVVENCTPLTSCRESPESALFSLNSESSSALNSDRQRINIVRKASSEGCLSPGDDEVSLTHEASAEIMDILRSVNTQSPFPVSVDEPDEKVLHDFSIVSVEDIKNELQNKIISLAETKISDAERELIAIGAPKPLKCCLSSQSLHKMSNMAPQPAKRTHSFTSMNVIGPWLQNISILNASSATLTPTPNSVWKKYTLMKNVAMPAGYLKKTLDVLSFK